MKSRWLVLCVVAYTLGHPYFAKGFPQGQETAGAAADDPSAFAVLKGDGRTVEFDFADISGGTKPHYLDQIVLAVISPEHHTENWRFKLADDSQLRAYFDLTKAKESLSAHNR